jgi:hypothetical protein
LDDLLMLTPGVIIPIVLIVVGVPAALMWYRRWIKSTGSTANADLVDPGVRLTSKAMRTIVSPPWRVVFEVGREALGEIDHVLIGPGGIYAIRSTMSAPPEAAEGLDAARLTAQRAVARTQLDEILQRCAMSSTAHVTLSWAAATPGDPVVHVVAHAALAVSGWRLAEWIATLPPDAMTQSQIDLAWQTVLAGIGRPDPLA